MANALVTDVQDPLKQGRVKLRFPWLDDTYVSDWTRTVQLGGVRGGGVFPMDVGDEVLVAFDRGALDHPFVIGGALQRQGQTDPGQGRAAAQHARGRPAGTPSPTAPATGSTCSDQQSAGGKQGVRLASGDGKLTVHLDRSNTEIIVDSEGAVSIKGSRSVSVEAGTDLTLTARRNLTIKSGGRMRHPGRRHGQHRVHGRALAGRDGRAEHEGALAT